MSSQIAIPSEFKEVMKEKILTAFMGMIPQEKIEELMNKEIDAFFNNDAMLNIQQTTIKVDNPNYNTNGYNYNNEKTVNFQALVFGSKMTPFRQLAWSVIYDYVRPKLEEILKDVNGKAKQELDKLLVEEYTPKAEETFKAIFTETAKSMSATMFYKTMSMSIDSAHFNMLSSLRSVGINPPADSLSIMKPVPLV